MSATARHTTVRHKTQDRQADLPARAAAAAAAAAAALFAKEGHGKVGIASLGFGTGRCLKYSKGACVGACMCMCMCVCVIPCVCVCVCVCVLEWM